jgi:hypothetical protein
MANQNYDQVAELFAQGKLSWEQNVIVALLRTGTTFDASAKTTADLDGAQLTSQRITGRWFSEGLAMGLPVAYPRVSQDTEYQIVVAQDSGGDPVVLAFIDTNADDSPITVQRTGTLIVRPVLPDITVPPEQPPTIGVWLRLGA